MNSLLYRSIVFLVCLFSASNLAAQGKCDFDGLLKENISKLESYKFIKQFPVETSKQTEKVSYTYLLNADTRYRMVIVDNGKKDERMIVTIRDREKKILATNKDKQKRDFNAVIDFECPSTGIYYFEATFENERKDCGSNILGFRK